MTSQPNVEIMDQFRVRIGGQSITGIIDFEASFYVNLVKKMIPYDVTEIGDGEYGITFTPVDPGHLVAVLISAELPSQLWCGDYDIREPSIVALA